MPVAGSLESMKKSYPAEPNSSPAMPHPCVFWRIMPIAKLLQKLSQHPLL